MEDNKYRLISPDGLSEVALSLIKKGSSAIGWVFNRETPKKLANNYFIEEVKNSDLDIFEKTALIANSKRIIKETLNKKDILERAILHLKDTAKPEQIDDDWLAQFMDKARLVSDDEIQMIWGRILAEECNDPGCVPRGLLHILEQMDKNDAKHFTALCSFSVHVEDEDGIEYFPVVIEEYLNGYYSEKGINYDIMI